MTVVTARRHPESANLATKEDYGTWHPGRKAAKGYSLSTAAQSVIDPAPSRPAVVDVSFVGVCVHKLDLIAVFSFYLEGR